MPTPPNQPQHKHLKIEKVRRRTMLGLGPVAWRWRTRNVRNGQIGVWSESYADERDCDASIHAHQFYLRDAPIAVVDA